MPPKHGTKYCYDKGCRRPECRAAAARYQNELRMRRLAGERTSVPAEEAQAIIKQAELQGYRPFEIMKASGLTYQMYYEIREGNQKYVYSRTFERLKKMKLRPLMVPSVKLIVLERALARMGWGQEDIAIEMGWKDPRTRGTWHYCEAVRPETAHKFLAVYMKLCYRQGPRQWCVNHAIKQGWKSPKELEDEGVVNG